MATLFKRPNSKFWQCAFINAEGRRLFKSTGETKKAKAQSVAVELERRARNLDLEGQQSQRAILAVLEEAAAAAMRGKLSGDLAREYLVRILGLSGAQGALLTPTIERWLRDWISEKERSGEPSTAERYKYVVEDFLEFLGASRGGAYLHDLQVEDVRKFRDHEIDSGKSPSSANLSVKTLRIPLNLARKQGLIRTNPAELVTTLKVTGELKKAFSPGQVTSLIRAAQSKSSSARTLRERSLYTDWEAAIMTAYFTGQRQSDVINMRWLQVDQKGHSIRFRQQKTGAEVVIPARAELMNLLVALPGSHGADEPVFATLHGKTSGGNNGLSGMFLRFMETAKIENTLTSGKGAGRSRRALSFHSLRHAFNTHLADAGVAQEVRQRLTGHASEAINDRYTHLGLETLRDAIAKLPILETAKKVDSELISDDAGPT